MRTRCASDGNLAAAAGEDERGRLLQPAGADAARALTCRRDDAERCGYADGSADDPQKAKAARRLCIAMALCGTFMLVEFVGGYYAHSLAVMSDAAHLLSDLGAFCVSLLTLTLASRRAPSTHSFGYHRAELLGALFSVASLWLVTGALLAAAFRRLRHPEHVAGSAMLGIALGGVVVNIALAAVLHGAQGHGHTHGGLSGAEGACGGGHGHSHGGDDGVDVAALEEGRTTGLHRSGSGDAAGSAAVAGSHGHSHAGGCCGGGGARPPLAPMRLGSGNSSGGSFSEGEREGGAFPEGATFFTRGRALSPPPPPQAPLPAAVQQGGDTDALTATVTIPPALAAATAAAAARASQPRLSLAARVSSNGGASSSSSAAATTASAAALITPAPPACDASAHEDVNLRGAYLHVLADLAQSCGVALAGALIWANPALRWVDPACTLVFSTAVLVASARLLRDVGDVIMERMPRGMDAPRVAAGFARLPGVAGVHDLHVWALMPGKLLLTVHLDAARGARGADVLAAAQRHAKRALGIEHATIQVEEAN